MEELNQNGDLFKMMAEASPNALILINLQLQIIYVNKFAELLFQYSESELRGKSIHVLIPRRYRSYHKDYINHYLENPAKRPMGEGRDLYALKKDETEFPAEIGLTPFGSKSEQYILVVVSDITKRKQAEDILKNEHLRLEGIIEGTNVGTWEWNIQTGELTVNEKWAEMLGYKLHELSPLSIETWERFIHPEDLPKNNALLQKHFAKELDRFESEIRMKHKNGNYIWVLDRGKIIYRTEDGKPLVMMGTHQDITKRKLAQIEFETILATTLDGFFIVDENGRIIEANEAFCNMLKYSKAELLNMSVSDVEGSEKPQEVQAHIEKILKDGYDRFETVHRRSDNSLVDIEISVTYIDVGAPKMIVFARDISERKRAEEIVKKSEENLKRAQRIGNVGHWEYRIPENELTWSAQTYRIYETKPEEFVVNFDNVVALFHPDDRDKVIQAFYETLENKTELEVTHRIITKDGSLKYITQRARNTYAEDGEPSVTIGTVQDITEIKKYENKLLSRNEQLAQLSKELQNINSELKQKNTAINQSIKYAKKIQYSILPDLKETVNFFQELYLYFHPKDVIGGDFYWYYKCSDYIYIAAVDCTGHSVPGAMMSMIVNSLLNEIIIGEQNRKTGDILSILHSELYVYLHQGKGDDYSQDGCDISLCKIDTKNNSLQFSGARQHLYIWKGNKPKILKATAASIGGLSIKGEHEPERFFETHSFKLEKNALYALTTDGILDQLDASDEAFGKEKFVNMLNETMKLPAEYRQKYITDTIDSHKHEAMQLDDMLFLAFKYSF
jgi:PAS domain S-box-containing protein